MFLGFVQLGNTLTGTHLTKNSSNTPQNSSVAPSYRVYGSAGTPMTNGTGSLLLKDPSALGGTIIGATNATPIVITSNNHGLSTGTRVTISGVTGNTNANADWQITVVDANNFSLNTSAGNANWTGGGIWNTTGIYAISILADAPDGYASGQNYTVLVTSVVGGTVMAEIHTFSVL